MNAASQPGPGDPSTDSVLDVIRQRRSISRVRPERPPRALVEQVLAAGLQAPNHHRTEPWRFIVLAGEAREDLGRVMEDSLRARLPDPDTEAARGMLEKERNKPLRAPVLIAVAVIPSDNPKAIEIEEVASGAAAVENMLLAAESLGLGAMWRTGDAAYDPAVKRFLGLPASAHIASFVYLGYPDMPQLPERRRDVDTYTLWRGWDD